MAFRIAANERGSIFNHWLYLLDLTVSIEDTKRIFEDKKKHTHTDCVTGLLCICYSDANRIRRISLKHGTGKNRISSILCAAHATKCHNLNENQSSPFIYAICRNATQKPQWYMQSMARQKISITTIELMAMRMTIYRCVSYRWCNIGSNQS